jgi:hypothetical protein
MNRRTFNELVGLSVLGSMARPQEAGARQEVAVEAHAHHPRWPDEVYRRSLVDMHVPDWDPALLSKFDANDLVKTIADAGFQSVMPYGNSCTGLTYWRSKIGQMNRNMHGRDFFGEYVQAARNNGLYAVAYYCLIYDNWAYEYHPDWRLEPDDDSIPSHPQRYGFACLNSPYREYTLACLRELVGNYDFEGIFVDMPLWPDVCYCSHCTERFRREEGAEPPRIVDWDDPTWRKFQAARQRWMLDFGMAVNHAIKETRPISVTLNYAGALHNWRFASPLELRDAMDYVCGDFYGGAAQHSLVCKTYHGLTLHRPLEFMTSRTRDLRDHVTTKPFEEIRKESAVAPLHSAAFMMIDAINVDGTINHDLYKFLSELNKERAPYEPFYGGDLLADVAIYFDKESVYNPQEQKIRVGQIRALEDCPHRDAVVGLARILREAHIPFGVVTNANLDQLKKYRAVLLPNVLEMTTAQADQFRKFVEAGGVLYASGPSSLDRFDKDGPRFLLEDVLGVRYTGTVGGKLQTASGGAGGSFAGEATPEAWRTSWTYLSPGDDAVQRLLWPQKELSFPGPMLKAMILPGAEVLATITLPFAPPAQGRPIGSRFGAIHSNPPALTPGTDPGIVWNTFGKGRAVWVAAPIESSSEAVNARLVAALLKRALPGPYHFEADTHPSVEMTLFHQEEKKRLLAGLLTMQQQLPAFPAAATVRVQVPSGRKVTAVLHLPERKPLKFKAAGAYVQFDLEPFNALSMALVEYA